MKILFLAPQPFFQERGTPIAVRLALEVLAQRGGDTIDLLTYHEGVDVEISNVRIHRIPSAPFLKNVRPGISIKKLICDVIFFGAALSLVWRNRITGQYQLIHAVEESVFMALVIKCLFGIPYIYDMDSSLSMQITEKWVLLKPLAPILAFFERAAIRRSRAVVPVCDALAILADHHGAPDMEILRDISLLESQPETIEKSLREQLDLAPTQEIILYIGNLESYQGIDLLIESFALVAAANQSAQLIIIGGNPEHIRFYQSRCEDLGISRRVHLLGPRPVNHLRSLLLQADILVSPRTKGNNTPMKIYSYLHAGKAIVATDLPTNTQVLDAQTSQLCAATPEGFSSGILELLANPAKRATLGATAFQIAEDRYTFPVFERSLNQLYDRLEPSATENVQ